jgi:hypothetical protein
MLVVTRSVIGAASLFPPLDRRLKIPHRGPSARVVRKVCEANRAGSFLKASQLLQDLAGVCYGPKTVQLITERVGARLALERDEALAQFLSLKGLRTAPPKELLRLLVISLDGGRLQTRQEDPAEKWKEDKVAVIYDAVPVPEVAREEYSGPAPITRSIVATMGPWDRLGDLASALADQRGYSHALQTLFLSDGAIGIRSQRERAFVNATFVLDWKHATDHIAQVSQALFGSTPQAEHWRDEHKELLWNGRVDLVIAHIRKHIRKLGPPRRKSSENDPRRILAQNLEYFTSNSEGMDYPTYRKNGWPIGSGIIESTVKQVGIRMKGSEKHWSMPGAEQTLQVVSLLISDDHRWNEFWRRCPLAQPA